MVPGFGDFGIELCKALGLDSSKTKDIIIVCRADSVVRIHTISYLHEEETEGVLNLMRKYTLTEDEKEEDKK
jgi:hypothetical protein